MSQPPGSQPRDWKPRADGSTELIRDVKLLRLELDQLLLKVGDVGAQLVLNHETIKTELAHHVSYKALWAFLLSALVANGALMAWYGTQVNKVVEVLHETDDKKHAAQDEKVKAIQEEWAWLKGKVDGSESLKQQVDAEEKRKRRK